VPRVISHRAQSLEETIRWTSTPPSFCAKRPTPFSTAKRLLIGGQWVDAKAGGTLDVRDPATGESLAEVPAFGPVVVALPFDDADDAVRLANDTMYGLGASIWSNDLARVHRMIPRIKAGTVWLNCHSMLDASLPFGGFKQSGLRREMSRAALDLFHRDEVGADGGVNTRPPR